MLQNYPDLLADVSNGRISFEAAADIAHKRFKLEVGMDEEEYRVQKSVSASRRRTCGGNIATKGMGHRSLGAKAHGKATVCVPGAGYGRADATRLYRVG